MWVKKWVNRGKKRILIITKELAEKIDGNRGDMSRADFLNYCISCYLEKDEAEDERYVTREEFERFEGDLSEVQKIGERILGKFEVVDEIQKRLGRVVAGLGKKELKVEEELLKSALAELEERVALGSLVLVEWDEKLGPLVKLTYPSDFELGNRLNDDIITAIYTLNVMSRKQTEHMRLEFKNSKVASIGSRERSVVILVLDPDQDLQEYEEKITKMAAELKESDNWKKSLPKLYEKYLS